MTAKWSRRSNRSSGALRFDMMPVLSAGRHRSPRTGACFMEFASFLAGERWSDHPECTHPGLAQLARAVNDLTSNEGRGSLAPLIPSVIGLNSSDPRLELILAVSAVSKALPAAPLDRQHALAVGAIVCEDALRRLGGSGALGVEDDLRAALDDAPEAERWARRFLEKNIRWQGTEVTSRQTHATIAMAVDGVRSACLDFPDDRLHELLASSIELCERFVAEEQAAAARDRVTAAAAETIDRRRVEQMSA